ncbi:hypothetical protein ACFO4O_04125 [Glaciecola siphonariae]|uniref:Uncharacterized protein n=1 Tax=Glaciecola siphonariae TaxID=521012 RepID=A0ABV9LSU4_9ALTE
MNKGELERLKELADRLIQSGAKAQFVSASETHEIRDGIFELISRLEQEQGQ